MKYYKLENTYQNWRKCIELLSIEKFCERFCNTTLCQVYRLIFFASNEDYSDNKKFYRAGRKEIEIIARLRNFDFFDIDPIEVKGEIITIDI